MFRYFLSCLATFAFAVMAHFHINNLPRSPQINQKYRIKDDSILRKIIKFKDRKLENGDVYPCLYFTVVPIYITIVICIIYLIVFLIDAIFGGIITAVIPPYIFSTFAIIEFIIWAIYWMIVVCWWNSVDKKTFKKENDFWKWYLKDMKVQQKEKRKQEGKKSNNNTKK